MVKEKGLSVLEEKMKALDSEKNDNVQLPWM